MLDIQNIHKFGCHHYIDSIKATCVNLSVIRASKFQPCNVEIGRCHLVTQFYVRSVKKLQFKAHREKKPTHECIAMHTHVECHNPQNELDQLQNCRTCLF